MGVFILFINYFTSVELGKQLATKIQNDIDSNIGIHDTSTVKILNYVKKHI